jgi:hypothetical protein
MEAYTIANLPFLIAGVSISVHAHDKDAPGTGAYSPIFLMDEVTPIAQPGFVAGVDGLFEFKSEGIIDIKLGGEGTVADIAWNGGGEYWIYGVSTLPSSPFFSSIFLDPSKANPVHQEGLVFYDKEKKAVSYYNEESDMIVNLGQEVLFPVFNNTGAALQNGTVVSPFGSTLTRADKRVKQKSRLIAVCTHTIEDNSWGYVTRLGQVGGLDTSMFTAGDVVHLGNNGDFTLDPPTDGAYHIVVGVIDVVDAVDGIMTVDVNTSDLTVEVTDTNGFPNDQREGTVLSIVNLTRTFTITPSGAGFHFYELGEKYEKTGADSVVFGALEGEHWFYYDMGVLTAVHEPTIDQKLIIIKDKAFVAAAYWNQTDGKIEIDVQDERHGIGMSPSTHVYLHLTRGAQFLEGYSLGDITADGNGNLNSSIQYSITAGAYFDEDLTHNFSGKGLPAVLPVIYNLGASGNIRSAISVFGVATIGGSIAYNQWTGAAWQLTAVPSNDYCLYHVFAYNGQTENAVTVAGQSIYGNVTQARQGANQEIANIVAALPFAEMIPIATIIYQANSGYLNAAKARIRTTDTGDQFVDWRTSELAQGVSPSSHANLTNVDRAATGVSAGHIDNSLPFQFPELTTAQRDSVTPKNGMSCYNTTTNEFNFRKAGVWVNTL